MPAPAPPPVKPRSVISASPGPLTTQPMIDSDIGVVTCASRFSRISTVLMTSKPCRAQDGQAMMLTPRWRRPSDFRMSKPTLTSSTGSAERLTRMVSPIPAQSRLPRPIADLTVPDISAAGLGDAEVERASVASASPW